jgi:hypothetical protein
MHALLDEYLDIDVRIVHDPAFIHVLLRKVCENHKRLQNASQNVVGAANARARDVNRCQDTAA